MAIQRRVRAATLAVIVGAAVLSGSRGETFGTPCLVTTTQGDVQGIDNGGSCTFLGIPFAAPPVGALRWRPPQPAAGWGPEILNASVAPLSCALINPPSPALLGNEDCLKLNIWAPGPIAGSPRPVIVWIHTGSFIAASANFPPHNGRILAERTGAIVVAANYRVGVFGFLAHPALTAEDPAYPSSGNYGLLDQRAALAWVRDHIAAFGGDPDNVTIAGPSAGGHSVGLHLVSPASAGLFHRAIMQSGFASTRWPTRREAESAGSALSTGLGCTSPSSVLTCLRAKTRNEVLLALPVGQQQFLETPRISWSPVVDGVDVPMQPRTAFETGAFTRVPVLLGTTRDEGWIYVDRSFPADLTAAQYEAAVEHEFGTAEAASILAQYPAAAFASPKEALARVAGDVEAVCEARRVARLVSRRTPTYLYSFEREVPAVAGTHVVHGLDTNFVFANNYVTPSAAANYELNADDLALALAIGDYWTRFAATGDPNADRDGTADGDRDGRWRRFTGRHGRHLVLDVPIRQGDRDGERTCDLFAPSFFRSIVGSVTASAPSGDLCGTVVDADVTLDHDVACTGNGLVVGADGIQLDLNGHTISGSGIGAGVVVAGHRDVQIGGGTIRNFEAGVRTTDAADISIRGLVLQENGDGIDLQAASRGNTVKENQFVGNRMRGIMIRSDSSGHTIRENTFTGNRVGILIFGGVDVVLKENVVSSSTLAGIRINVFATGNLLRENIVSGGPAGIEFLITPTGSATGNTLRENRLEGNTCGIKGPTANNTLRGNVFNGNVADVCQ